MCWRQRRIVTKYSATIKPGPAQDRQWDQIRPNGKSQDKRSMRLSKKVMFQLTVFDETTNRETVPYLNCK